jgi:hypothetical protein
MVNLRGRNTNAPTGGASYAGRQARLRLSGIGTVRQSILAFRARSRKRSIPCVPSSTPGTQELSIKIIEAVLDLTLGSSTDKLVLLVLARHANDQGRCWPSIGTLTSKTELSERSVHNSIARLTRRGQIEVIHMPGRSNVFVIHTGAAAAPTPALRAPPGVHLATSRGAPAAPRIVKDPSFESSMKKSERPLETVVDKIRSQEVMRLIRSRQGDK